MFLEGVPVRVSALAPPVTFPVPRGTPSTASLATWDHSEHWRYYERDFAEVRGTIAYKELNLLLSCWSSFT